MLEDYEMSVYVIENQKPVQLTEIDYGHFFSDEIYIIDLKGKKHRYVVTWMGPKLNPQEMSQTSSYMDMVTNYENSNSITRCRVGKGHEEESLMSLFPNGFINYIGKRVPIDERIASIK